MKAIVYDAPRQFSYRDVPPPEIKPDEVIIRVRSCGIGGTDLHDMHLILYPMCLTREYFALHRLTTFEVILSLSRRTVRGPNIGK